MAYLSDGDTSSHGDYELRYVHEFTGSKGGRHVIEAHDPEDGRVGRMEWMGRPPYAVHSLDVSQNHQRKGLATAMWDWSQDQGRPKPTHSAQRTDKGDAWARSVGGKLPRRIASGKDFGSYFGGQDGRVLHTAGRGKPRRDGSSGAAPGGGGGGAPQGGETGPGDSVGAGQGGARSVEFHPQAVKDLSALDKPVQRQIHGVIEGLAAGTVPLAQTHTLTKALAGWSTTKASRGHRIVHRNTDDGGLHIGYIGLHDYGKAERRLGKTAIYDIDPIPTYQELAKPWERRTYDIPQSVTEPISRGVTIPLSDEDHAYVHDRSVPVRARSSRVINLISAKDSDESLGMHWTTNAGQAHHFSRIGVGGMLDHPNLLSVVLHAHPPEPEHIEHDPRTLWHHGVQGQAAEGEVPLKQGAPVRIHGVEWSDSRDHTKSHSFHAGMGAKGIVRTAARKTLDELAYHQRAVVEAQNAVRLEYPTMHTEIRPGEDADHALRHMLKQHGHPGHEDAFVSVHDGSRSFSSTAKDRETGAVGVVLHPARADYGTLAHEAAHLLHDHQTGRGFREPSPDESVHGIGFIGHYAKLLDPFGKSRTPGGNRKGGGPGDLLLNTYYDSLNRHRKTSVKVPINSHEDYAKFIEQHYGLDAGESGRRERHPKTGWPIAVGEHRSLARPLKDQEEGSPVWNISDHGEMPNPPMLPHRNVRQDPIEHVYRGVSQDEWKQAQDRGYLRSDQRGTIADWEGTNAATDPRSAVSYLPHSGSGHVLKIRVHPDDEWFTRHEDDYLRTRKKIPLHRVEHVSPLIHKDDMARLSVEASHAPLRLRIFGPTHGLDHRLFAGDRMKLEVRAAVMGRLGPVLEPVLGQDWQAYVRVYMAGSEASEWTSEALEGNGDFDTLLGIDYDHARDVHLPLGGLTDADITDLVNTVLRVSYNASPWVTDFGDFDLTGYCNAGSWDIRKIKPYAAYNISDDEWTVRPPHLPDWSVDKFPEGQALVEEAEGYASVIEAIDRMPEPYRTQQGKSLWKHLHGDRSRAFSDQGEGWQDPGNAVEKALNEWGLWDKLVEWQYGKQVKTAGKGWESWEPRTIHRGMGITLPDDVHDYVHDSSIPRQDRAARLVEHIGRQPHGMHWTDDPDVAKDFASRSARKEHLDEVDTRSTPIVVHADAPDLSHIETDKDVLYKRRVRAHDDEKDAESEVPMKAGSPVNINAVTWADPASYRQGRHRFQRSYLNEPVQHTAAADPLMIKRGVILDGHPVTGHIKDGDWNAGGWDPDVAHRLVKGTATHHDVLKHLNTNQVGHFWYHPDHADIEDAQGFASPSEPIKNWMDDPGEDGRIAGEVGVVMEAHHPKDWDPDEQNPSHPLMGNSYLPDHSHLKLHKLHYTADGENWHTIPVEHHGITVHTDGPGDQKTAATAYDPDDDDHYRSYTDWDKAYPRLPEDIHRGVAVQLDPDTHEAIHGEGHSDAERAHAAMQAATLKPLGMHWSSAGAEMAGRIAEDEAEQLTPRERRNTTHVILHADRPERQHIETDINRLVQHSMISHGRSPENEVPLKEHAPVHIWGVSWKHHDEPDWHSHEFDQPMTKTAVKSSDHEHAPDLPQEQHDALTAEPYQAYKRQSLDLAKNPVAGTHIWRGEVRQGDPIKGMRESGVGMHWTVNPDALVHAHPFEDEDRNVVWHGEIESPGQGVPRSHPMWHGRHQSMDSEAEVRFKPGTSVKIHGYWMKDPAHPDPGYLVPRIPERTGPGWRYHPVGEHAMVSHKPSTDLIDYSDVGIGKEAMGARGDLPEDLTFEHRPPTRRYPNDHQLRAHAPDGTEAGHITWFEDDGEIAGVETHPDYQRRGLATELHRRAREISPHLTHSDDRTDSGEQWVKSLSKEGNVIDITAYFKTAVKSSDHEHAPDLPQEQHDALTAEPLNEYYRQTLNVAKDPKAGTHMWRGETRSGDPVKGAHESGVGMHWGINPSNILFPRVDNDDEQSVVYHAELEHPGEQNYTRDHPMWQGKHRSLDHEAEIRLKPGSKVKLHGVWVKDPKHPDPGYFIPRMPERMSSAWSYHPIGEHVTVAHKPKGLNIDYGDVGIGKEGSVIDITAYFKTAEDDDYRLMHRPPNEQSGRPLHHLDPDDEPDEDEHVRIYRSAPPHVDHFDTNTWATTNPEYAHLHGRHPTDPSQDWPVMSAEVPKSHVYTDFNDDNEVGYQGPRLEANELEQHHEETGEHTPFTDYQPPKEDEPEEHKPKKGEMWGSHVLKLSPEDYKTVTEKSFMPEAAKTVLKHLGNGVTWHPKGSKHTPLTVHDQSDHWHAETHAEMLMGAQHPEGHHEPGTAPLLGVVVHTKNGKTIDRVGVNPHVDYSDKPSGFYNGFKNLPVSRAAQHPSLKAQSAKTWVDYFGVAA